MKIIEIDGSFGEGGGQILRTALSLSCITRYPFKLYNIRKGRKKPGLMPQHLTCVHAASLISNARVSGDETGSTTLSFTPERIKAGDYLFDIKTAGSCSLVLQTILPPLIFADKPSFITIKGGTHVPFSPIYHYISEVFLPMLGRIGIKVESSINKYGFYPKGGGEIRLKTFPVREISGLTLLTRGKLLKLLGYSGVANLPLNIAERQRNSLLQELYPESAEIQVLNVSSQGQGTFIFLKALFDNTISGFSSLGQRGKPAEKVGKEVAIQFVDFYNSLACLDPYLSDQIVIYLCLASGNSSFTTSRITQHLVTNLWIIEKFLNIHYEIEGDINSRGRVSLFSE